MKTTTVTLVDFENLVAASDGDVFLRMDFCSRNFRGLKIPRFNARGVSRAQNLITIHLCVTRSNSQQAKEVGRFCFAPTPDFSQRF